jgi:predicted ATP-grasp superfamily ATP-dependent carboligase
MYTGALENRPEFVSHLAKKRELWGNTAKTLHYVRDPFWVSSLLSQADLPCPHIRNPGSNLEPGSRWLVKPLHGAGGRGIRFSDEKTTLKRGSVFLQEFISGLPCAAVFVGIGNAAVLLGVTEQLIGQPWLNVTPFVYCGSIGPLDLDPHTQAILEGIGGALAMKAQIRGLFGIDFVLRDGLPWIVEVNPRYTASVEVLEFAHGLKALDWHRRAFVGDNESGAVAHSRLEGAFVGKAILFAKTKLTFPNDGPWTAEVRRGFWPDGISAFADIPQVNQPLDRGRPILTLFAKAGSRAKCLEMLKEIAADLDHWLFGR